MEMETQLQQSKKELKQANIDIAELQEYQLFVNTVQEYAIFFLDTEGNITRWGPGAEKIYRYQANEVIGKHFSFLYTDEDVANGRPAHNLKEADEKSIYEEVRQRLRKEKLSFWAHVVITSLRDAEDGTLVGFAKIVKDISKQKALEDQLKKHSQALEEKNRALDESNRDLVLFATIAAHDLQAPIRKVGSFCEFVEVESASQLGEKSLDYLRRARASAEMMQMLISDLLQLAKISQEEVHYQSIKLPELIANVLNILEAV